MNPQRLPTALHLLLCYHTWAIRVLGLFLIGIGLMAGLSAEKTSLRCDRAAVGACQLSHRNVYGQQRSQTFAIADLQQAQLETTVSTFSSSRGSRRSTGGTQKTTTYRVLLIVNGAAIPFDEVYTAGPNVETSRQAQVEQINGFIGNPAIPILVVDQDARWFGLVFVGAFGVVGLGLVVASMAYRITFNTDTGQYNLR